MGEMHTQGRELALSGPHLYQFQWRIFRR